MSQYVIIESGDTADPTVPYLGVDTATSLAAHDQEVVLFLVQNGVFLARRGARQDACRRLLDAGVTLLADDFSLRERGIGADRLCPGISPSSLESLVDHLAAGHKVIWY